MDQVDVNHADLIEDDLVHLKTVLQRALPNHNMVAILSKLDAVSINEIGIELMEANPVLRTFGCTHRLAEIIKTNHISTILQVFLDHSHDLVVWGECYSSLVTELRTLGVLNTFVDEGPNSKPNIEFLDRHNVS